MVFAAFFKNFFDSNGSARLDYQKFFVIPRKCTEEFLRPLLNADLDFVIWYRPYVAFSQGNQNLFDGKCADLAVIDVRYKNSLSLQSYDIADNWFSWQ